VKDHKQVTKIINHVLYEGDGSLNEVFKEIRAEARGLVDPKLSIEGYDGELTLRGWRPLTAAELAAVEKRRQKARETRAAKTEREREADTTKLLKLADKLGIDLPELP
jgi:hypothetical protein